MKPGEEKLNKMLEEGKITEIYAQWGLLFPGILRNFPSLRGISCV